MFCESPLDARKDSAAALDELSRGDPDLGQILTFFDAPGRAFEGHHAARCRECDLRCHRRTLAADAVYAGAGTGSVDSEITKIKVTVTFG